MSEVIKEKIEFLDNNRDLLVENLNLISYQLFLVLSSDKALEEINAYQTIKQLLKDKEVKNSLEQNDTYLIHSLLHILNKVVMCDEEKQKCMNQLFSYSEYINSMREEKIKKNGKIIA